MSIEIVIYAFFLRSVIFPYNSLNTQAIAYTTHFELGEPVPCKALIVVVDHGRAWCTATAHVNFFLFGVGLVDVAIVIWPRPHVLRRRNLKVQQSPMILYFCSRKTRAVKSYNDYRDHLVFENLCFQNFFCPH